MTTQIDAFPDTSVIEQHATERDWLEARRSGIGSSDAAAIVGVSPWKSPMQLWAEKLELVPRAERETEAMRWGKLLEEPVAQRYAEVTGRVLHDPGRFTIRRSVEYPFMLATLDREIVSAPTRGLLEVKTAGYFRKDEWEDEPPVHVQVQVQHQLAVTGWRFASVAALLGGQTFVWFDIERNDRFIGLLIEREREFFARLRVQEAPEVDGSDATRAVLAQLYPREVAGLVVNLGGEAVDLDGELERVKAEQKALDADRQRLENTLKGWMGEAEVGIAPNGTSWTWRAQERKGYVVESSVARILRRKAAK